MDNKCVHIWDNCLRIISDNIPVESYNTWFVPIRPMKLENSVLTIEVPSHFFYEFIEEKFIDLLRSVLRRVIGENAKLEYSIVVDKNSTQGKVNLPSTAQANTNNTSTRKAPSTDKILNPFVIPGIKKITVSSNLNKNLNFDNFIVGSCNRVAFEAGNAIAKNPGNTPFNPLFIYSKSGLGKTHIAQAIGIETKRLFPEKTVLYLSANMFTTQYTQAVLNNTLNDFMHFYQMVDLLIIDDIHELAGKTKTQNVFFHIFNHLHQSHKQLILTSDRAPIELEGVTERLLNRFKWGLSTELSIPDFETRKKILIHKAKLEGIVLNEDIIDYICKHVKTSVRELEGSLVSLIAHSTINNQVLDLQLAESIVKQIVKNPQREVTIPYIKKKVGAYFNLTEENLVAKTRRREIVQARQIAMYFAREITKTSLASIGAQIGHKDHATVLHACRTVENLMDTDRKYRIIIEELRQILDK